MWKSLCVLFIFSFLLASCQIQANNIEINDDTVQNTDAVSEIEATQEVIIYDEANLIIFLKGANYNTDGVRIDLLFVNNSEYSLTFSCSTFVVNNIMIDTFVYTEIAAGAKSNTSIYLDGYDLDIAGIERVNAVRSYDAHISYDASNMDDLPISLDMSFSNDPQQIIDETGCVLYAENGITIFSKFVSGENNGKIPILIKNESDMDLNVWTSCVTVNGHSVQEWHYAYTICNDSYRFLEIELAEDSLESNNIDTIENASFTIDFLDPHSTESIFSTGQLYVE